MLQNDSNRRKHIWLLSQTSRFRLRLLLLVVDWNKFYLLLLGKRVRGNDSGTNRITGTHILLLLVKKVQVAIVATRSASSTVFVQRRIRRRLRNSLHDRIAGFDHVHRLTVRRRAEFITIRPYAKSWIVTRRSARTPSGLPKCRREPTPSTTTTTNTTTSIRRGLRRRASPGQRNFDFNPHVLNQRLLKRPLVVACVIQVRRIPANCTGPSESGVLRRKLLLIIIASVCE